MVKNLPNFNDIKNMSYQEIFKLRCSLINKIKVRKARYKKELASAKQKEAQVPNPQTCYEKLEVKRVAFDAKSTDFEIMMLQTYLDEVEKHYNKFIEIINCNLTQPEN